MTKYRDVEGIHYTILSNLSGHPLNVINKRDFPFTIGAIVDCLAFTPNNFKNEYFVADIRKPAGQMGDVYDIILPWITENDSFSIDEITEEQWLYIYDTVGFKRDKLEKVKERFITECRPNLDIFIDNRGKTIISLDDMFKAESVLGTLKNNEFTSYLFDEEPVEGIERHYQFEIYWDFEGNPCKALLDILEIDHVNKCIIPYDLKCLAKDDIYRFENTFVYNKYYLQASFYSEGVYDYIENQRPELADYEIKNFIFVVADANDKMQPLIWPCSDNSLFVGEHGGTTKSGYHVKGYRQLIKDYLWHKAKDYWTYPREYIEKGFIIDPFINPIT